MGFTGMNHWVDSDMAADLALDIQNAVIKVLNKALKERGNSYNTDGVENVALVLEDLMKSDMFNRYFYASDYQKFVAMMDKVINELDKRSKDKNNDWATRHKSMSKNMKKFMDE